MLFGFLHWLVRVHYVVQLELDGKQYPAVELSEPGTKAVTKLVA